MNEKEKEILIECPYCGSDEYIKKGYNRTGEKRRYLCKKCRKYYSVDIDPIDKKIEYKTDKEIELENNNTKFNKVTVKINGFLKSTLNKDKKEKEEKFENIIKKKEDKKGFRFIYLHGPNVEAFKRLADDLDLIIELKDKAANLYKIINPHYNTTNNKKN